MEIPNGKNNTTDGGFSQIDHTADVGIKISGSSLEELFKNSFSGLLSLIVRKKLSSKNYKSLEFSSPDKEALLVDFLNELIYLINVKRWLPDRIVELTISDNNLKTVISGQEYEIPETIGIEMKAATYHKLKIRQNVDMWETEVFFDV